MKIIIFYCITYFVKILHSSGDVFGVPSGPEEEEAGLPVVAH